MDIPKINLHIHSNYSDGSNSIEDILKKALESGFDYIAITDHFTDTWKANIIPTLDNKEKILMYTNEISEFQKVLKSENSSLRLFSGIEVDIRSSLPYVKKLIDVTQFQVILFEHLENINDISFTKRIIKHWNHKTASDSRSPIFGLAHFNPGPLFNKYSEILLDFLEEYSIYFEFNSSYSQYYSLEYYEFFRELKYRQIPVGIGSDAHSIGYLKEIQEPIDKIKEYNLEENLLLLISKLKKKEY